MMITQVTKGIKISVQTTFEGTFFKNYKMHYAFGYTITSENQRALHVFVANYSAVCMYLDEFK